MAQSASMNDEVGQPSSSITLGKFSRMIVNWDTENSYTKYSLRTSNSNSTSKSSKQSDKTSTKQSSQKSSKKSNKNSNKTTKTKSKSARTSSNSSNSSDSSNSSQSGKSNTSEVPFIAPRFVQYVRQATEEEEKDLSEKIANCQEQIRNFDIEKDDNVECAVWGMMQNRTQDGYQREDEVYPEFNEYQPILNGVFGKKFGIRCVRPASRLVNAAEYGAFDSAATLKVGDMILLKRKRQQVMSSAYIEWKVDCVMFGLYPKDEKKCLVTRMKEKYFKHLINDNNTNNNKNKNDNANVSIFCFFSILCLCSCFFIL